MIRFFLKHIKQKFLFSSYILINIIINLFTLILPIISAHYINKLISNVSMQVIYEMIFVLITFNFIQIIPSYINMRLNLKIQSHTTYVILEEILTKVQHLPLNFYFDKTPTSIIKAIHQDVNSIVTFCFNLISNVINNLFILIFISFYLFQSSKTLFLLSFLFASIYLIFHKFMSKKIYEINSNLIKEQNLFFGKMVNSIEEIKNIKIYNLFKQKMDMLEKSFKNLFIVMKSNAFFNFFYGNCHNIIQVISQSCMYLITGKLLVNNDITLGGLTILSNYFQKIISSFMFFGDFGKNYQKNKTNFDRLQAYYKKEIEHNGKNILNTKITKIKISNLSFSYNENNNLLKNINTEFNTGINLIKGNNGAGKSTLIDLIIGLYPKHYNGEIKYNETEISNLNMYETREYDISYAGQNATIVDGDIYDNIKLNNNNISDSDIDNIMKSFNFDLNNIDSKIHINSLKNNKSGGEFQKIMLTRSLLSKKDILIFDEPLSSLDKKSKNFFVNKVNQLSEDTIIIIVTHDSKFDKFASNILYI